MAQFFVGKYTLVCDAYGIKSPKTVYQPLYDNIKTRSTTDTIGGKYEISKNVADLLSRLFIKQFESESCHQQQSKAEQHYGVVKRYINTLINLTGSQSHCWLLYLVYVWALLNVRVSPALDGITAIQAPTGQVPDISQFLHLSF